MGRRLRGIDQDERAGVVRSVRDLAYRVDRAEEAVRHMRDGNELRPPTDEQPIEILHAQAPLVIDPDELGARSRSIRAACAMGRCWSGAPSR